MCPKRILYIDASSAKCRVTDEKKCDKLGGCERVCPAGAIKIR
jgi:2-oxoglutarate ferredoxin oxidoreductase subunit delta